MNKWESFLLGMSAYLFALGVLAMFSLIMLGVLSFFPGFCETRISKLEKRIEILEKE